MLNEKTWLEVSLLVNGELAESVSEVLSRFGRGGVAIEALISESSQEQDIDFYKNLVKVAAYLPVDEKLVDSRQKLEEALWYLGRIQPLPEITYEYIQEQDWADAWKKNYHPIAVGNSLVIVPAWLKPEEEKRLPVLIDPGMAFGTGTHPSTILCLKIIEEYLTGSTATNHSDKFKNSQNQTVIDIGCGSGILCIAALKLGAEYGLAVDVDPLAVEAAHHNADLNHVEENLEIGLGSLAEIQAGIFSINKADLVFVNILAPVIIQLLSENLKSLLSEHGHLILSGLIDEQEQQVVEALTSCSLKIEQRHFMGDWIALVATKENY